VIALRPELLPRLYMQDTRRHENWVRINRIK